MMEPREYDDDGSGLDRRSVLRRGAVLGGALVWTVPAVQTIAGPAFATGSPRCDTDITYRIHGKCLTLRFDATEACCSCAEGLPPLVALPLCWAKKRCVLSGPPTYDC